MDTQSPFGTSSSFLMLCLLERASLYEDVLAGTGHHLRYVNTLPDLMQHCVGNPPLAVFVDVISQSRFGPAALEPVFALGVRWPILRAHLPATGHARAISLEPLWNGPLVEVLDAITSGDPTWNSSKWSREAIRMAISGRVRLKTARADGWKQGNLGDISVQGAFVYLADPPEVDEPVAMEIYDLSDGEPISVLGRVRRCRKWEDGPEIPGAAIAFDTKTVRETLIAGITRAVHIESLLKNRNSV